MEQGDLDGVMAKIAEQERTPEWQRRNLLRLSFNGTFANILENVRNTSERLQERFKHDDSIADKRETRQYEKGTNKVIIELGWEYFRQTVDKNILLSRGLEEQALRAEQVHRLLRPANYLAQFKIQPNNPSRDYYEEQVQKAFDLKGTERARYSTGELPPIPRYFLFGYGLAALEAGLVDIALLALNDGNWLNDPFEGAGLQDSIIDKVQTLGPASQVQAAETWEQIKADRVQLLQTSAP